MPPNKKQVKLKDGSDHHISVASFVIVALIALGTFIFHHIEDWSVATSFYFSVATLTTVGYGDFHPASDFSRVVAALYILVGTGTTITAITVIATDRINRFANRVKDLSDSRKEKNTED